ncbi:DapH/DapD/GlmU-related protein [Thiomicrorhabdus sp. Milos-T2]|uniref:acyltransferase n=1 Tax=Thiomicrorhabdus sp. Milos-T2 TaxID=90814 RepID=UPI00068A37BA|nr:acyltransferase [Thiomicrorhabdus sp. Milos-T2]
MLSGLKERLFRYMLGNENYFRRQGVKIGKNCRLLGAISIGSEPHLIKIGDDVSITESIFITHDGGGWVFKNENDWPRFYKEIKIGNKVFIGTRCIITPGAVIEDNVVIGAGSLVHGTLESGWVYAGIPAKKIKTINEYGRKFENI